MSLKTYLQKHFVDKPAFASLLGITVERLDDLVAVKAIPEPRTLATEALSDQLPSGPLRLKNLFQANTFAPSAQGGLKSQTKPRLAKNVTLYSQN